MEESTAWQEQTKQHQGIAGDRRDDRRYQIRLDLRWRLVRRRKILHSGDGQTLDLSSGGLLMDAGRPLPAGLSVELSIAWPVLLNDVAPLQLAITGRIVRSAGTRVAIRIMQHEFRTAPQTARAPLPIASARRFEVETLQ